MYVYFLRYRLFTLVGLILCFSIVDGKIVHLQLIKSVTWLLAFLAHECIATKSGVPRSTGWVRRIAKGGGGRGTGLLAAHMAKFLSARDTTIAALALLGDGAAICFVLESLSEGNKYLAILTLNLAVRAVLLEMILHPSFFLLQQNPSIISTLFCATHDGETTTTITTTNYGLRALVARGHRMHLILVLLLVNLLHTLLALFAKIIDATTLNLVHPKGRDGNIIATVRANFEVHSFLSTFGTAMSRCCRRRRLYLG
jgi:hypothetical protein